jgi:hypothetical protein
MTAMTTEIELRSIAAGLTDAATPHQTLLTDGPISLRVTSSSPEPLTALVAAAAPYLHPTGPDHPLRPSEVAEQIHIHADPVMAERLRRLVDGSADHRVRLVRASAGGGERYRAAFLLWEHATPHTTHLVLDHPGPATDRVTLRLVRGIAGRCLITAGWVPLHAAAALTRAGLIVLVGHSGAGKTTALLHLLAERLAHAVVANDKVYLTIADHGVHAQALPTSLAVRPDTIAMFPALGDLAAQVASSHVDNHADRAGADRRLLLPPRALAEAFGVALYAGAPVTAIVAIRFTGAGRPSRWRRAGPGWAVNAVTTGYLDDWFIDESHEYSRLGARPESLRAAHHTTLRRIASAVPIIELDAGAGTPRALQEIIADLKRSADQTESASGPRRRR